uniref:Dnq protein n=1 Tax=Ravinvirus N15 TaxID=40631 RepID=O21967_9CAUD|nr:putative [Escherichia phage N15]
MVNIQKTILAMIMHKWLKSDYLLIDTETTGLGEYAEIIEIAIINMRGEVLLDTLVKPTKPIPPEVTEINHITNEMVASAPAWCDVFPKCWRSSVNTNGWPGILVSMLACWNRPA